MYHVKNLGKGPRVFNVTAPNQYLAGRTLAPGEADNLDLVDRDSDVIKALEEAKLIEISAPKKGAAAHELPPEPVPAAPVPPVPAPVSVPMEAIHKGRGHFSVMRGEEEIATGLNKDEAHAFNAMSDEDKAAFVAERTAV